MKRLDQDLDIISLVKKVKHMKSYLKANHMTDLDRIIVKHGPK